VVSSPNPIPHAKALLGVQHENRPRGPEGDVEGKDRQHERAHRRVVHHPSEPFGDFRADAPGRHQLLPRRKSDAGHEESADTNQKRLPYEREGPPGDEQRCSDGRPGEMVDAVGPRGLGPGRSAGGETGWRSLTAH
jgi:hypothetical protein